LRAKDFFVVLNDGTGYLEHKQYFKKFKITINPLSNLYLNCLKY